VHAERRGALLDADRLDGAPQEEVGDGPGAGRHDGARPLEHEIDGAVLLGRGERGAQGVVALVGAAQEELVHAGGEQGVHVGGAGTARRVEGEHGDAGPSRAHLAHEGVGGRAVGIARLDDERAHPAARERRARLLERRAAPHGDRAPAQRAGEPGAAQHVRGETDDGH
jgi:hypothetical protein